MIHSPIIQRVANDCEAAIKLLKYPADEAAASELMAHLQECVSKHAEHLAAIAAVPKGNKRITKQMHKAKAILFDTGPARVCAALRALVKSCFIKKNTLPVEASRVIALAKAVSIWAKLNEPVTIVWKPKDNGGLRPICKPGPLRKAQQIMLNDVLLLLGIDNEFDFTRKGANGEIGFRDEVIKDLGDGYGHWWTVDIMTYFMSLKIGHFGWLHLHSHLMGNVVCIPECAKIKVDVSKVQGGYTTVLQYMKQAYPDLPVDSSSQTLSALVAAHSKHLVRRGLPQGSCLSVLLARAFVGRVLREEFADDDVRCLCWIDNVYVGTRTHCLAKKLQASVTKHLQSHPAGPIMLHDETLQDIKIGRLNALGYVFQPGKGYEGNPVHVKPGWKRIKSFYMRLRKKIWKAGPQGDPRKVAEQYACQWFGSNGAWTKVPFFSKNKCIMYALAYVEDWIDQVPFGGMTTKDWDPTKPYGGYFDLIKNVPPLPPWLKKYTPA